MLCNTNFLPTHLDKRKVVRANPDEQQRTLLIICGLGGGLHGLMRQSNEPLQSSSAVVSVNCCECSRALRTAGGGSEPGGRAKTRCWRCDDGWFQSVSLERRLAKRRAVGHLQVGMGYFGKEERSWVVTKTKVRPSCPDLTLIRLKGATF